MEPKSILDGDERPKRLSPAVIADDEHKATRSDAVIYPPIYEGHLDSILISHADIARRSLELANLIQEDLTAQTREEGERTPLFLCVLKGASVFFHLLLEKLQEIKQPFAYEFIRAKSYEGASTTGNVHISGLEGHWDSLNGRHVIIVEDIIDTGTTLSRVIPVLEKEGRPKSLRICALLEKRLPEEQRSLEVQEVLRTIQPTYSGFSIPNKFVIGFGLDYNEAYRDLRDIWVISPNAIALGGKV